MEEDKRGEKILIDEMDEENKESWEGMGEKMRESSGKKYEGGNSEEREGGEGGV